MKFLNVNHSRFGTKSKNTVKHHEIMVGMSLTDGAAASLYYLDAFMYSQGLPLRRKTMNHEPRGNWVTSPLLLYPDFELKASACHSVWLLNKGISYFMVLGAKTGDFESFRSYCPT